MTISIENPFPPLLRHSVRADWGVGILAGETDGKYRYLFENGTERTLASGFSTMMHRVEKPSDEERAAYARLRGILAARSSSDGTRPAGLDFAAQVRTFHAAFPGGLSDPRWVVEVRGEGAKARAPSHRAPLLEDARQALSQKALDSFASARQFGAIWEAVTKVLSGTDLVAASQLKVKSQGDEQTKVLALAVRELLYGTATYDVRFDRFCAAFATAFGAPPRWELATALSAVVHPTEHVCVEGTTFRKQAKAFATHRAVAPQASGSGYASFLAVVRLVANKLSENGELPRDLFDVRDFITLTLKAAPKKKAKPAKPVQRKADDQPKADE
jgi:hypothetical protein